MRSCASAPRGDCCFDMDSLDQRLREVKGPAEKRASGRLHVFLPPQPGREYIVAVDPAGGGSQGDYAAVEVIDRESGVQCAELQQRLRPRELSVEAVKLAREYSSPGTARAAGGGAQQPRPRRAGVPGGRGAVRARLREQGACRDG